MDKWVAFFASTALIGITAESKALAATTVNRTTSYQYISGFGISANDPVDDITQLPPEQQKDLMDFLFEAQDSTGRPGISASIVRLEINPFDPVVVQPGEGGAFPTRNYPLQATFKPGPTTLNWETDVHQRWFATQAISRGVRRFLASVWSPPAWMKVNNSELITRTTTGDIDINASRVKADHFDDLAQYFSQYLRYYSNIHSIPVGWLSLQNEPSNNVPWAAAAYTPEDFATAIDEVHLRFGADGIGTKILGPETEAAADLPHYMSYLQTVPATLAKLDIVATHNYSASRDVAGSGIYGKPVWHTEGFPSGNPAQSTTGADSMFFGLRLANDMRTILNQGSETYFYWWAVQRASQPAGQFQGLVRLTGDSTGFFVPKRAYAFGHFSRFVRPGYRRVFSSSNNGAIKPIAFRDPASGRTVLTLINDGTVAVTESISGLAGVPVDVFRTSGAADENIKRVAAGLSVQGGAVQLQLPAQSITTIVEYADHMIAPGTITDLAIAPHPYGALLTWTAPGDNGAIGTALSYEIRRSSSPITASNWASATLVRGAPAALEAGQAQRFQVVSSNGGIAGQYFAVRAYDEWDNVSAISNVVRR